MEKRLIMGMWKFDLDRVTRGQIEDLAQEFAKDDNYTQIYVRKSGGNQVALGFSYMASSDSSAPELFKETYDMLLKRYGIAIKGYDVSEEVTPIKGL